MIVGIDEVGRGCLAGPVCVAAVALTQKIPGVTDSKKLKSTEREMLAALIKQKAIAIGIGWASHAVIDEHGLTAALRQAALMALQPLTAEATEILLDGNHNYIGDSRVATIINGDGLVPVISAASIVAKVARDHYMACISKRFPDYGFERHVGYGTPEHRAALHMVGPCAIHRMSFAPLRVLSSVN